MPFTPIDPKESIDAREKRVQKFWEDNKIFEKSVEGRPKENVYTFYDGPPFATGLPHYGHIVASTIKDVVPRYWTMRGKRVARRWGWDCHGLPIENIVEKELGSKSKKDIEATGVATFNEMCRSKVLEYADEWARIIPRLGRWADMTDAYRTMDRDYMESVWWVFKQLWDKGLVYEDYRSMHICPRCETTLSQSEVAEGYTDMKDLSVIAKFKIKPGQTIRGKDGSWMVDDNTFILAWTTTPWTLPGNVALAVGKDIEYVGVKNDSEYLFIAKSIYEEDSVERKLPFNRVKELSESEEPPVIATTTEIKYMAGDIFGNDLVGLSYEPLFDAYAKDENLPNRENGWKVYAADFVTTEEGTGVVHIAPAFGEDDLRLGRAEKLPFVQHVGMDGVIAAEVGAPLAGLHVKPKDNVQATDVEVIKYLAGKGLLFSKEKYEHSYPVCWRCDTPLLNYATSSWFVAVTKIKEQMLDAAAPINWSPAHIKEGRFGKWLEGARDWSISRQRFWASVMPIWVCDACGDKRVFGSAAELEAASGQKVDDLHKHIVDEVTFPCEKCSGVMTRVPDVLDTWFDSGSMPYAQEHYPFAHDGKFENGFPADFIAEGVDQTRAWFYYQHVLATALFGHRAFDNVIVNGIVLAEDGKKMSKKLQNYPDPMVVAAKYGADPLRLYLMSSPVVAAENLRFSEKELAELSRGFFRMLWQSYSFFVMYANVDGWEPSPCHSRAGGNPGNVDPRVKPEDDTNRNVLDRWILARLQQLIAEATAAMDAYDLQRAARSFGPFVDDLSNWYIRRSRKRFWKSEDDTDKNAAYATLHHVLVTLVQLMAPFTPFMSEEIYRNLSLCHSRMPVLAKAGSGNPEDVDPRVKPEDDKNRNILDQWEPSSCHSRAGGNPEMKSWIPDHVGGDNARESVHLTDWPTVDAALVNDGVIAQMAQVRDVISKGLELRASAGIKVRQPLQKLSVVSGQLSGDFLEIIKDELNVKNVVLDPRLRGDDSGVIVELDTAITPELKLEGQAREVIRVVQEARKKARFNVDDRIVLGYTGMDDVFADAALRDLIAHETLATEVVAGDVADATYRTEAAIDGAPLVIALKTK